jgi:NO-binding membrane sensor protein with MHYT domain
MFIYFYQIKEKTMSDYYLPLIFISYAVAVMGSLMALLLTRSALRKPEAERNTAIALAAVSLGGVGIWSMHFIGMLALDLHEIAMNYNWWLTIASLFVAVAMVYIGLRIVSSGEFKYPKLITAGVLVGSGVVAMHYTGMLAMEMQADVQWSWGVIAISAVIAVVASIVALWLAIHVSKMWQVVVSALVMGVAVCGMHYTGMEAADYMHNKSLPYVEPLGSSTDPFVLGIIVVDIMILVIGMITTMSESNVEPVS